jgi:hypothetical protein
VACLQARNPPKFHPAWTSTILPWEHALWGVCATSGYIHPVAPLTAGWDTAWRLYWRQWGCAYKAPHKATWPPAAEAETPTIWYGGGMILNFGLKTYFVTPEYKSLSGWVQRMVAPAEVIAAYEVHVHEQTNLAADWSAKFLPTLQGRPPICILKLMADALIPIWDLKVPTFMGGGQLFCSRGLLTYISPIKYCMCST